MIARGAAPGDRITQLDGWRGISICCVIVSHLTDFRYGTGETANTVGVVGGWGVSIFFVISGFIITKLALVEFNSKGAFSCRDFYIRRFFRIVPPFFLYLAAVILLTRASIIEGSPSEQVRAAAFVCNIPNIGCGWFTVHSWSLAYEEQFYLVFPVLFAVFGRGMRAALACLVGILIALPFLRYVFGMSDNWRLVVLFSSSFVYISIGAVMAGHEEMVRRLAMSKYGAFVTYAVLVGVVSILVVLGSFRAAAGGHTQHIQTALYAVVLPIGVGWLVVGSIYQATLLSRALTTRPLLFLGAISYSLYLWQQLFTAVPSLYVADTVLFTPPLMLVVASLSYYLIERPMIRLGKRLLAYVQRAAPPLAAVGS